MRAVEFPKVSRKHNLNDYRRHLLTHDKSGVRQYAQKISSPPSRAACSNISLFQPRNGDNGDGILGRVAVSDERKATNSGLFT